MEHSTKKENKSGLLFGEFLQAGTEDKKDEDEQFTDKGHDYVQERRNLDRMKRKLRQRISLGLMTEIMLIDSMIYDAPKRVRKQLVGEAERRWDQYRQSLWTAKINGRMPRSTMAGIFTWY